MLTPPPPYYIITNIPTTSKKLLISLLKLLQQRFSYIVAKITCHFSTLSVKVVKVLYFSLQPNTIMGQTWFMVLISISMERIISTMFYIVNWMLWCINMKKKWISHIPGKAWNFRYLTNLRMSRSFSTLWKDWKLNISDTKCLR